jgi:hypothetical protein
MVAARVARATPVFNSDTGKVSGWHYVLLLVDASVLKPMNAGHADHVLGCRVTERKPNFCRLLADTAQQRLLISRNDPPGVLPEEDAARAAWGKELQEAGGQQALDGIVEVMLQNLVSFMDTQKGAGA